MIWYGGRGADEVRYLREMCDVNAGVGEGALGVVGRRKSLR